MLYFEDFEVGQRWQLGSHSFDAEAIIRFAREFDPQPFHLPGAEGARSAFGGGLVASGWHTASVGMRLLVEGLLHQVATMGSPGVDELRWWVPVRPGDTVSLAIEVVEVRPSSKKPDRGAVTLRYALTNQRGEQVLTMKSAGIIARKPA